jgi:sialate O-acetylesterase
MRKQFFLLLPCLLLLTWHAWADVTLPALLADHMVVQRGLPVHVWGMAFPDEAVVVSFRDEARTATADNLGRWSLYLPPGEAGGPFAMTVKGNNTLRLNDILVGDVWVASGQSNMEFSLKEAANAEAEIASAKYPRIRIFQVEPKASDYQLEDVTAKTWVACAPEIVSNSSAVAYFFARNIEQKENVPIGLIESYWGGTPAEAWTSLRSLSADASLMPVFSARSEMVETQATMMLQLEKESRDFFRTAAEARGEGKPAPSKPWHPDFAAWAPSTLYNGMIAPLTLFAIRGVIWYQGESNASLDRAFLYARLFQTMIRDWRRSWGQGDFPFLFVQIANFNATRDTLWPEVRDAQRQSLALRNTGMAVTIDIGDATNIHPTNKKDVGLRLALAARAISYGEKIEYSGPLYREVTPKDHAIRVWFDHAASGLVAKNGQLKEFEGCRRRQELLAR